MTVRERATHMAQQSGTPRDPREPVYDAETIGKLHVDVVLDELVDEYGHKPTPEQYRGMVWEATKEVLQRRANKWLDGVQASADAGQEG